MLSPSEFEDKFKCAEPKDLFGDLTTVPSGATLFEAIQVARQACADLQRLDTEGCRVYPDVNPDIQVGDTDVGGVWCPGDKMSLWTQCNMAHLGISRFENCKFESESKTNPILIDTPTEIEGRSSTFFMVMEQALERWAWCRTNRIINPLEPDLESALIDFINGCRIPNSKGELSDALRRLSESELICTKLRKHSEQQCIELGRLRHKIEAQKKALRELSQKRTKENEMIKVLTAQVATLKLQREGLINDLAECRANLAWFDDREQSSIDKEYDP